MPPVRLDMIAVRSIIKFELQQAPKCLLMAAHGKDRTARDDALSALADRVAARFGTYTITTEVSTNPMGTHIAVHPSFDR